MAAISNLGFDIQAADVGTRAAIGLRRGYQHIRRSRDNRLVEYFDALQGYDFAIENLYSGGVLSVNTNHPLRAYIAGVTANVLVGVISQTA
jgi:hypothetical protein